MKPAAIPDGVTAPWPPSPDAAGMVAPTDGQSVTNWATATDGVDLGVAGLKPGPGCGHVVDDSGSFLCVSGSITNASAGLSIDEVAKELLDRYRRLGLEGLAGLRGQAVIAIWDAGSGAMHLLRHPGGSVGLYYRADGTSLEWATRCDALIRGDDRVDLVSLAQFLRFGSVVSPRTLVEGIRRVVPFGVVTFPDGRTSSGSMWVPNWEPPHRILPTGRKVADLQRLLDQSVEQWLATSNRAPAILLSGGVDSVGLAASARRLGRNDLVAYTVAFDQYEGPIDEMDEAHRVAEYLEIDHVPIDYGPDFIDDHLDWMVGWYDQPFGYPLHTAKLAPIVEGGHDLVLGGTGGDGYFPMSASEHRWRGLTDRLPGGILEAGSQFTSRLVGLPGMAGLHKALELAASTDEAFAITRIASASDDPTVSELLGSSDLTGAAVGATLDSYRQMFSLLPTSESDHRKIFAAEYITVPDNGGWWMQQWMSAYGLRPAMPYLEPELTAYMASIANRMPEKGDLRELAATTIPRDLAFNRKIGQSVPLTTWFRGPLRGMLQERLGRPRRLADHLDTDVIDRLVAEHLGGHADHKWMLWKLITLDAWLDRFDSVRAATAG